MLCSKCGRDVPDDSIFCPNCGARFPMAAESQAPVFDAAAAPLQPAAAPQFTAQPQPSAAPQFPAQAQPAAPPAPPEAPAPVAPPPPPEVPAPAGQPGPSPAPLPFSGQGRTDDADQWLASFETADPWRLPAAEAEAAPLPAVEQPEWVSPAPAPVVAPPVEASPQVAVPAAPPALDFDDFAGTATASDSVVNQATTVRPNGNDALPWLDSLGDEAGPSPERKDADTGKGSGRVALYLRWILIGLVAVIVVAGGITAYLMLRDGSGREETATTATSKVTATTNSGGGTATSIAGAPTTGATGPGVNDGGGTPDTTTSTEAETTTTQTTLVAAVDLSSTATLKASSTLKTSGSTSYAVGNLIDGDPGTCWAEGAAGYGLGQWVEFRFASPVTITRIQVLIGYDKKTDDYDRWLANGRLHSFTLEFSDGSRGKFNVKDLRTLQTIKLASPHKATWMRLTITAAYPATESKNKAEDTSIGELHVLGDED